MAYFLESNLYKDILEVVEKRGFKESDMKIVYTGDHNDFSKQAYLHNNGLYDDEIFPFDFDNLHIYVSNGDYEEDIVIKVIEGGGEIGIDYIISVSNIHYDIENIISFELLNQKSTLRDRGLFIKLNKEHLPVESYNGFDEVYVESFNIFDAYRSVFKHYKSKYFLNEEAKHYEGEIEKICSINDILKEPTNKNVVVFVKSYELITELIKSIGRGSNVVIVHLLGLD